MRPALPRLHAITDERIARRPDLDGLLAQLGNIGQSVAVHARGRALSGLEHYELAVRPSAYPSIRRFVNDRLDVALAAGATGVQLSRDGLPPNEARRLSTDWWIGRSVHSLAEAQAAQAEGADYLLAGPVYRTATHPTATPLGVERLRDIARLGVPVIAIGGVTPERAPVLAEAGVHGVAAIRAIWDAADPVGSAREMLEAVT